MWALEDRGIRQLQPTSGSTRFLGSGKIAVLAPAITLRNRFGSYGVEINNAFALLDGRISRLKIHGAGRRATLFQAPRDE